MNILRQEFRQGLRPFLFWTLGLALLVLGGMVKFLGFTGADSGAVTAMLAELPRPVLAMFGMAGADVETLGGFYGVLQFYALLAVCCFAVQLGTASVLRERVDKTYEFLFTKPCGRLHVLWMKLLAGLGWLAGLCVLNAAFSLAAPGLYGLENTVGKSMLLFAAAAGLAALFFFSLSALLATACAVPERAVQLAYTVLLLCYGLAVAYDMDASLAPLRFFTPLRYFPAAELLAGHLPAGFAVALVCASLACLGACCAVFQKKDLTAV